MNAIIWREIKVTFSSIFGAVSHFATPVFMILLFATALSGNIGKIAMADSQVSYIEFFAPGLFGYMTFFLFGTSFSFLSLDSRTGILSVIAMSKASLTGYFWGKYIFQFCLTLIKILLIMMIAVILAKNLPEVTLFNSAIFIITLILGAGIWFSLGMIGGIYLPREDVRAVVITLVSLPLTFASSMYYGIDRMPAVIRWIALINPLTYICNLFRGCYLNNLPADYLLQLLILFIVTIVALSFALFSLSKVKL